MYCFLICLLLILCFYRVDGVEKLKNAKETIVPIIWFEDGIEKVNIRSASSFESSSLESVEPKPKSQM